TLMVGERPPPPDMFWGWWSTKFSADVLNGTAETVLLFSTSGQEPNVGCPAPAYFAPGDPNNFCDTNHFWSFHPGLAPWAGPDGGDYRRGVRGARGAGRPVPGGGAEPADGPGRGRPAAGEGRSRSGAAGAADGAGGLGQAAGALRRSRAVGPGLHRGPPGDDL